MHRWPPCWRVDGLGRRPTRRAYGTKHRRYDNRVCIATSAPPPTLIARLFEYVCTCSEIYPLYSEAAQPFRCRPRGPTACCITTGRFRIRLRSSLRNERGGISALNSSCLGADIRHFDEEARHAPSSFDTGSQSRHATPDAIAHDLFSTARFSRIPSPAVQLIRVKRTGAALGVPAGPHR